MRELEASAAVSAQQHMQSMTTACMEDDTEDTAEEGED
jgi:hypothetical protein